VRRVLFIANGHGETAIAARVATAVAAHADEPLGLDLLPLVGIGAGAAPLAVVGPRRTMPSGGLVAMGNVRAFAADLRAGFAGLFARQLAFVRAAAPRYDAVVAVGDAFALGVALVGGPRPLFVGTAKSVYVAPYGPFERCVLRRAARVFVRDAPTAKRLRAQGVPAESPGNVIVDLVVPAPPPPGTWLGVLPGSRTTAYADGVRLARVAREAARLRPGLGILFSVAPTLEAARFARDLAADGWTLDAAPPADVPFAAVAGGVRLLGWAGPLGGLLAGSVAVLGQAGTANEQAAAFGIPVVAIDGSDATRGGEWYRMRQRRLLGDAMVVIPADPAAGAAALAALLAVPARLAAMGAAGRARMGPPGGADAIARAILAEAS
jgi:uncharacterized protein (TIGR03492 family)